MLTDRFKELRENDTMRKRLAKLMARDCFRNTKLEDLHAGVSPSSETGDYSDVKVVSPYGEIPWKRLSRLSDKEMKELDDRCRRSLLRFPDRDVLHEQDRRSHRSAEERRSTSAVERSRAAKVLRRGV